MRNLLALVGLLVVGSAGLGWYLGWYKLSFSRSSEGSLEIKTNVDTKKVGNDSAEFIKNVGTVIGSQAEQAIQDAKTSPPPGAPGVTPGPVAAPASNSGFNPFHPAAPNVSPVPPMPNTPSVPSVPPRGPIPLIPPK